jgi:hypothetical protein
VRNYLDLLDGRTQRDYFLNIITSEDKHTNFRALWDVVIKQFETFGQAVHLQLP